MMRAVCCVGDLYRESEAAVVRGGEDEGNLLWRMAQFSPIVQPSVQPRNGKIKDRGIFFLWSGKILIYLTTFLLQYEYYSDFFVCYTVTISVTCSKYRLSYEVNEINFIQ